MADAGDARRFRVDAGAGRSHRGAARRAFRLRGCGPAAPGHHAVRSRSQTPPR